MSSQATGPAAAGAGECIHCGFCLPACPTYDALGTEMDSPRGRLYLMSGLESGRIEATESVVRHLDLCLGCRACETDCPSGVPYGAHLERAREHLRGAPRPASQRLLESLLLWAVGLPSGPQRLGARILRAVAGSSPARALARLGSRAGRRAGGSRLAAALSLLDAMSVNSASLPAVTPAAGVRRRRAGILEGCVNRWVFGNVNAASARLLSHSGCEVVAPADQGCCGALHLHSGDLAGARRLARVNIAAFERAGPLDAIVVTAAGCGAAMKEYASLFHGDEAWEARAAAFAAKSRDALELIAEAGPPLPRRAVPLALAYHDACHLAHAQGVRSAPRELLASVPGLTLIPLAESDRCCGSAGIYNVLQPETANLILDRKIERLRESGADAVAAANPGCLLQIATGARRAGLGLRVAHPLEILDEATRP